VEGRGFGGGFVKRLICVLLCAVLLAGCGRNPELEEAPSYFKRELDPVFVKGLNPDFISRLELLELGEKRLEIINRYHPNIIRQLITKDYGRLYPFPANGREVAWRFEGLYGLMTADGRIVVDAAYSNAEFFDVDDGYYRVHKQIPDESGSWGSRAESYIITANGSHILSGYDTAVPIGNGLFRVNERRGVTVDYIGYEYISVINMSGLVVEPFFRIVERYVFFKADELGFSGLYVDLETKDAFFTNGWILTEFDGEIVNVTEDSIEAAFRYSPKVTQNVLNIPGLTMQISDNLFVSFDIDEENQTAVFTDKDGKVLLTGYSFNFFIDGDNIHLDGNVYDFSLNKRNFDDEAVNNSPHNYDWVHPIHDGLRQVGVNGFIGVVDSDDNWLIKIDTLKFKD
jgi:hypothetical protein